MTGAADQLSSLGYRGLFQRLEPGVDAVWDGGAAGDELRAVAHDPRQPDALRFLAAEVLFRKDPGFHPDADAAAALAAVYAAALRDARTGNPWGFAGHAGEVADHVARLGQPAVEALRQLLYDDRALPFEGSEEATAAGRLRYRVKDVAADLIARVRGLPWDVARDPLVRDSQIEELGRTL